MGRRVIAWLTLHTMATAVVVGYAWELRRDLLRERKSAAFWRRRANFWFCESMGTEGELPDEEDDL